MHFPEKRAKKIKEKKKKTGIRVLNLKKLNGFFPEKKERESWKTVKKEVAFGLLSPAQ